MYNSAKISEQKAKTLTGHQLYPKVSKPLINVYRWHKCDLFHRTVFHFLLLNIHLFVLTLRINPNWSPEAPPVTASTSEMTSPQLLFCYFLDQWGEEISWVFVWHAHSQYPPAMMTQALRVRPAISSNKSLNLTTLAYYMCLKSSSRSKLKLDGSD